MIKQWSHIFIVGLTVRRHARTRGQLPQNWDGAGVPVSPSGSVWDSGSVMGPENSDNLLCLLGNVGSSSLCSYLWNLIKDCHLICVLLSLITISLSGPAGREHMVYNGSKHGSLPHWAYSEYVCYQVQCWNKVIHCPGQKIGKLCPPQTLPIRHPNPPPNWV